MDHRRALRTSDRHLETLAAGAAYRDNEPAARLQLLVERLRETRRVSGDGDPVEGGVPGQTKRPVADVHLDTLIPCGVQPFSGLLGELRDPLDRVYLSRKLSEHRCLITRPGADVEHAFVAR